MVPKCKRNQILESLKEYAQEEECGDKTEFPLIDLYKSTATPSRYSTYESLGRIRAKLVFRFLDEDFKPASYFVSTIKISPFDSFRPAYFARTWGIEAFLRYGEGPFIELVDKALNDAGMNPDLSIIVKHYAFGRGIVKMKEISIVLDDDNDEVIDWKGRCCLFLLISLTIIFISIALSYMIE